MDTRDMFPSLASMGFFTLNEEICGGYWERTLWTKVVITHNSQDSVVAGFLDKTADEDCNSVHCYDGRDYIFIPMRQIGILSWQKIKPRSISPEASELEWA